MKNLMLAAALGLTTVALAAPATKTAPTPAPTMSTATAPGTPAKRDERMAQADQLKKELNLSDAQAAAMRNENERFRGVLISARAEHRANVAKILTPEQMKMLEDKMKARRGEGGEMDDDEHEGGKSKDKPKEKDRGKH